MSLSLGEVSHFTIDHLSASDLADAWPIVRMSLAHADGAWWLCEAGDLLQRGGGVLAAHAPDGSIHGIATYEPVVKPRAGKVLAVDRLIAFELSRSAPCRRALCDAIELLAPALGCNGVALAVPAKGYLQHRSSQIYGADG